MNPVVTDAMKEKLDPGPNATALPKPTRPSAPAPKLSVAAEKPARSTLLSLNLKRLDARSPADAERHDATPASPSSRSKTKVGRSITEKQGHKRAMDDKDGPGLPMEKPNKRQKGATPPGSPRGSNSPVKQMVKSPRAVMDLSVLAGDARRRNGTASPPSSPRTESNTAPSLLSSPGRARTDSSLPAKAPVEFTGSAPAWRSTSEPEIFDTQQFFSKSRPVAGEGHIMAATPGLPNQARTASVGRPRSPEAEPAEFTFAECDYGSDGELVLTPRKPSSAPATTALSGADLPGDRALSITMIKAELLPKAQLQRAASISYRAALGDSMGLTGGDKNSDPAPGVKVLESAFKTAQDDLETEMMLIEIALEGATSVELAIYLGKVIDRIAACKAVIASSGILAPTAGASAAVALAQPALSANLDAMEVACKTGVEMLAEERAIASANAAASSTPPRRGVLISTPSSQALLNDLDALMDEEILPATSASAVKAPAKRQ